VLNHLAVQLEQYEVLYLTVLRLPVCQALLNVRSLLMNQDRLRVFMSMCGSY
jgi:hypothetical protein